jgi:hypothetical protein
VVGFVYSIFVGVGSKDSVDIIKVVDGCFLVIRGVWFPEIVRLVDVIIGVWAVNEIIGSLIESFDIEVIRLVVCCLVIFFIVLVT